ncbi:hypothetical protein BDD12DRAFT_892516 [Trichophaea hybrida]|nr:hypothetical protein BDD12DRAFT_892516 [Trichophaea hybrida]
MAVDSCQITNGLSVLRRRATGADALTKFLSLVQSPFKQSFTTDAFLASLGTSLGISLLVFIAWCVLRPYHSLVYAPKLRHADEKRAPPTIGKGYFSWVQPLLKCHEKDLVDKIGMDATIFLRFMRLCRTLFFYLGILGCLVMIPVNVSCNLKNEAYQNTAWRPSTKWYILMSPTYTWGQCMWAHVIIAWIFDFIIMYFLWRNYRMVVNLKRDYFENPEYSDSLYARTLMIWNVPSSYRSDAGLNKIVGGLGAAMDGKEKCAIGRNVKELPSLIKMHEEAVRNLEKALAKYFKHPERLPLSRPVCNPDKDDKTMDQNMKVDAIEYYKHKIEELEKQIAIVRKSIDRRDAMPYGFVSFQTISRAHITAKAARGKHPKGTSIQLATKSQDIIWENLVRSKASRRWNSFLGNLVFFLLSVLFVIPNALIAVFLSNLNNIAIVWPSFTPILARNSHFFAIVQGFLAPTITSIIYLLLPIVMRRLSAWQGDITKSSRERHVTHKLYVFFIINNLIMFTIFGTLWTTIREFATLANNNVVDWNSIRGLHFGDNVAIAIFDVSTFWITYLLQRNLGAILDLVQVVSLIGKSFTVRFMSPTPREKIEWTAPTTFEYSTYYNYFLFYTTVALCFSTVQPLVLPVAFLYFLVDSFFKKYTLMYVFVTKVESGGTFWRLVFNRLLFATGLFNCVVSLIVWSRYNGSTACAVLPLLPILVGFKIYCHRTFDLDLRYYTRGFDRDSMISSNNFARKDRLEMRYCHPALHRKLMKPMVHGKAEHLMPHIYGNAGPIPRDSSGSGINLDVMQQGHVGKKIPSAGFEIVQEEDMDFANFKNRAEFGEEHGAGYLYGDDYTIGTMTPPPGFGSPASSRPGSPVLRAHSPFAPVGGPGFRGVEYIPVTGPAPPRSPGFSRRSFQPEGPYDFSDSRSETGSVSHLLREQHPQGPLDSYGYQPQQSQQSQHPQ